jgi:hypothetical protein
MDSDQALALLRARNRFIRHLPSGLWARIALPGVAELLASGEVPMPVLREMAKQAADKTASNGDGPDVEPDEATSTDADNDLELNLAMITESNRYRRMIVQRALRGIAASEEELGTEDVRYPLEVIDELAQEDFDQIFVWGDRQEPIDPKAETPASET